MRYLNLYRNLSNWYDYLGIKYGLNQSTLFTFKTRNNIQIEVPRQLLSEFKEIFMSEVYAKNFSSSDSHTQNIIDIGANVGFFSLFALSRFPRARIFAFEPIPSNFRQLERQLELNPNQPLFCFQQAVGRENGEVSLRFNPNDDFSTNATVFNHQDLSPIQVSCITLEEIFRKHNLDVCNFLKMDCEGSEYDILYEAPPSIFSRINHLAIEVHQGKEPDKNADALEIFLKDHGFKTYRQGKGILSMLWAKNLSV